MSFERRHSDSGILGLNCVMQESPASLYIGKSEYLLFVLLSNQPPDSSSEIIVTRSTFRNSFPCGHYRAFIECWRRGHSSYCAFRLCLSG